MEIQEREKLSGQCDTLKQELKIWEREFAASHGGKKASREEIKQNPTIASKYTSYHKLQDVMSGKLPIEALSEQPKPSRKRKHDAPRVEAPSKRLHRTPSKPLSNPGSRAINLDPYDSPSLVRTLFTPLKNRVIGPTPQKDGVALGLFDLLSPEVKDSPSKSLRSSKTSGILATPSKSRSVSLEITARHSRTPLSTGKRNLLNIFMTPSKESDRNAMGARTPSSVSKLHFSTPSFLRRDSQRSALPVINEATDPESPKVTRPRKMMRGLSSILANLRKMEEEAADDDLDALREWEGGESGSRPVEKPKPKPLHMPADILVEDSQVTLPLGGFDDEALLDSEPEEQNNRDGQELRVYKKKGQKRTTRRVKMKPVRGKPKHDVNTTNEEDETEAVPETQVEENGAGFAVDARNFDTDTSGSDYTASEGGTRYKRSAPKQKKNKEGVRSTKVGALAHANFKRLKLRNSGAKGGPGHGSKFRRRR